MNGVIVGVDVTGTGEGANSVKPLDDAEMSMHTGLSLSSETVSV